MNTQAPSVNTSQSIGVNFDVKEQAFTGNEKGIPIAGRYSYPNGGMRNAIGEYLIPPAQGNSILRSVNGVISWLPIPSGSKYVVTVQNGQLSFVAAPDTNLQLFNNSLGWTATETCD
jgi:hypothetical protein